MNAQAWTTPLWPLKLCCSVGSSTVSSGMGTPPKRTILPCSIYAGSNAPGLCGARGAVSMLRAFGEKVLEGTANSCRVRGVFGFCFCWFGVPLEAQGARGGDGGDQGRCFWTFPLDGLHDGLHASSSYWSGLGGAPLGSSPERRSTQSPSTSSKNLGRQGPSPASFLRRRSFRSAFSTLRFSA